MQNKQPDSKQALTNISQIGIIITLIAIALLGLDYDWKPASPRTGITTVESAQQFPDAIVENPFMDEFNPKGYRERQLTGKTLQHFESDKRSVVFFPVLTFQQQSGEETIPWKISASQAVAHSTNSTIVFEGDVVLWSDTTRGGRTEIRTGYLSVNTDTQFAETDKAVKITTHQSQVTASGLKADLANETILLPSRVKELHEVRR